MSGLNKLFGGRKKPANQRVKRTATRRSSRSSANQPGRSSGLQYLLLRPLRNSLSGEWLGKWNKRGLPFFSFLAALFVIYIGLVYRYESDERGKRDAQRQLLDVSNTHKSLLSEFETQLQRSKLDEEMADIGLVQPASPPQIITAP